MKTLLALLVTLASSVAGYAAVTATIELHYGKPTQLSEPQRLALQSSAMRLVESSNFNSERHREILKATPVQTHAVYRKTIAGRYLLVSFGAPQRINTVGGEIVVREIVVGLNRPDYADSLFTIDAEGRVITHGKYSGGLCIELMNEVSKVRPGA